MVESEWSALEEVLRESLDGFVVLDRGVQLEGAPALSGVRRADLAGVNRAGQLVLVHVLPRRDELLEAAVDLLTVLRERRNLLVRHLADPRLDASREGLAVVVVEGVEPAGIVALRALRARELRVYERVRVLSGRASSAWIVPLELEPPQAAPAGVDAPLLEWIERVDSAHRPLVDSALEGLARLDPELSLRVVSDEVLGSLGSREMARLRLDGRRVVVALGDAEQVDLEQPADVERALDRLVRLYLAQLEAEEPVAPVAAEEPPRAEETYESFATLDRHAASRYGRPVAAGAPREVRRPAAQAAPARQVEERKPVAYTPAPGLSADELAMLHG